MRREDAVSDVIAGQLKVQGQSQSAELDSYMCYSASFPFHVMVMLCYAMLCYAGIMEKQWKKRGEWGELEGDGARRSPFT